jgi:hypothetical protein
VFWSLPSPEQSAYRRATVYRETAIFLALGAVAIVLAHGIDLVYAGGPNWPALTIRVAWAAILLLQAVLLLRGGRIQLRVGAAGVILGSAVLDLLLIGVTGRSASPIWPFAYVLEMTIPLVAFELLEVGLIGSLALAIGMGAMLVGDNVSSTTILAFVNAAGGAFIAGWLLSRGLIRARTSEETRHLALAEAFRTNADLVAELRDALANVKTLSGLLPVCAWCHRARSDSGYWQQIEAYVVEHSEAQITHGLCPDCAEKLSWESARP